MSKCDLRIELDRAEHLYKVGDTVRCTVYVSVDKPVKCNSLTITNMWKTHGKGNKDSETIGQQELFQGEWQAGEYNYSYSFEIKEGPLTYRGHHMNIDRYIKVRADIPWAIDPKAEIEYIVDKGGDPVEFKPKSDFEAQLHAELNSNSIDLIQLRSMIHDPMRYYKVGVFGSITALVIGGLIIYSAFFTTRGFGDPIFGTVLIIMGIIIGFKMIKKKILHGKIGRVSFEINPRTLRASESVKINFEFTPNVDIDVNKIAFSLVGMESATSGSGTNRRTYTHEFHNSELELTRNGLLMRDMPVMERATIEIPHDAPHSFRANNNSITWRLRATMDINKSPDWHREEQLEILI